eukprot:INCI17831.1.p1 GENE.INCI17831.1~~INCI17831.1.p1  ORF type:complete len:425 (+),score=70.74 INCI17831.1:152-1426(+)
MLPRRVHSLARKAGNRVLSRSSLPEARLFSSFPEGYGTGAEWRPTRAVNLSAGCAALPLEVLERAQKEFLGEDLGLSVTEMGYRTKNFLDIYYAAEESFRTLMNVPDNYEIHFFNGGATLQFAALPLNLCGGNRVKKANYIMNGHWSEKALHEAQLMGIDCHEVCHDDTGLYFTLPKEESWNFALDANYIHYTSADTRQGFEYQEFPYHLIPKDQALCSDMSANLGSKEINFENYGVVYAAAHKNFSTSGVCYTIIRKDLIPETLEDVMPGTPTMCNWNRFHTAPDKIWNVPVIFSVWLGLLTTDWMKAKGGLPYFEELAIRRSNMLYDFIDDSDGFYRTFVTEDKYRSRMNVVFTIRDGEGPNEDLVEKFLVQAGEQHGWLDIRSHPLGISSAAIRVTMYNPQPIEVVEQVREFMHEFKKENA